MKSLPLIAATATATGSSLLVVLWIMRRRRQKKQRKKRSAYESLIGNTPCIRLPVLSDLLQRDIYVKCEHCNPGGTGKDRAALSMIQAAEDQGLLPKHEQNHDLRLNASSWSSDNTNIDQNKNNCSDNDDNDDDKDTQIVQTAMLKSRSGGLVVEGTSGSTGIALASICAHRGHACLFVLPDDQAQEKSTILRTLGASVHIVPTASISNPKHYVNVAKRLARRATEIGVSAVFTDQFENFANFQIHYQDTGPEIYRACRPHAFCMSAGTGGTIAGVGKYLKEKDGNCRIVLVDPPGSVLYSKIQHGVAFTIQQRERALLRHRYDTIAEGIGLDRVTANVQMGLSYIDSAIAVTDQEAVDMAHWILKYEGLWVGSSSAMNLVGAVQVALELPTGSRVCTILCDGGARHVTRFWNRTFLNECGLEWPSGDCIPECLRSVLTTTTTPTR